MDKREGRPGIVGESKAAVSVRQKLDAFHGPGGYVVPAPESRPVGYASPPLDSPTKFTPETAVAMCQHRAIVQKLSKQAKAHYDAYLAELGLQGDHRTALILLDQIARDELTDDAVRVSALKTILTFTTNKPAVAVNIKNEKPQGVEVDALRVKVRGALSEIIPALEALHGQRG